MSHKATLPFLIALILAHVVLASAYMLATPYRQGGLVTSSGVAKDIGAPDERQHANYIARLIHGEGYPVFNPKDPNLYENYQAHQPPLYYTVAAVWAKILQVDGVEQRTDGLKLRFLNVLIGAIGVAGVFFLALWGYHRERVALAAAAIAALLPMNLALSGAISNDPLLICLCTWVLALLCRIVRGHWTLSRALLVGVLIGAAILTKTTAVALLPILALACWDNRPKLPQVGAMLGILALIAVPWWIHNVNHYGDPFALKAFNEAFVGSPQRHGPVFGQFSDYDYWVNWVGFWTARSFLGVFGYMDVWLTQSGLGRSTFDENRLYWVAIAFILFGFLGWALSWRDSRLEHARKTRVILLVFLLLIVALFVRFNSTYFQAQARYLLPALGPIACILAVGYRHFCSNRKWIPLVSIVCFLAIVNAFALVRLGPQFDLRIKAGTAQSSTVLPRNG